MIIFFTSSLCLLYRIHIVQYLTGGLQFPISNVWLVDWPPVELLVVWFAHCPEPPYLKVHRREIFPLVFWHNLMS